MRATYRLKSKIIALLCNDIVLLFASISIILVATLYPFNFTRPEQFSLHELRGSFENSSTLIDQINNVLLFMPLGFAIASIFQRRRINLILQVLAAIIAGAILSSSVELLQTLLPSRSPTPADIFNNSWGSLMGLISFYIWNSRHFHRSLTSISDNFINSKTRLYCFLCGYICLASLVVIPWQGTINLSDWNTDLPLVIGNEPSGNRPWQGYLSQLAITDRALTREQVKKLLMNPDEIKNYQNSLIGYYQFQASPAPSLPTAKILQDQTGKLPEFSWRGSTLPQIEPNQTKGVKIDANSWLETVTPTNILSQRLRDASQFTISTTIASTNINQTGPARIISLSRDALYRNLTLGQEQQDLDIRIRTPLTGENGADMQIKVPKVFSDQNSHQIVVTYNKATLNVYVDKISKFYSFNLFELLPLEQKLFYYAVTFIPVSFYLVFLATLATKGHIIFRRFILTCAIALPSLLLETALIHETGKSISLINLGLGIFFTIGLPLLFKIRMNANSHRRSLD